MPQSQNAKPEIPPPTTFATSSAALGLPLSEEQRAAFTLYAEELEQWNQRVNLTAITGQAAIELRHFLDSLSCALVWGDPPPLSLIDLGSGAGFPGLPLKLLHRSLELALVESVGKKADFLDHIVQRLGLSQVTVLRQRAEQVGRDPQQRGHYAVVTARAVAELRVLAEYALPLLQPGGCLIAHKGANITDEITAAAPALTTLNGVIGEVRPIQLPGLELRHLVVVVKTGPTPERYPRANSVPARRPL